MSALPTVEASCHPFGRVDSQSLQACSVSIFERTVRLRSLSPDVSGLAHTGCYDLPLRLSAAGMRLQCTHKASLNLCCLSLNPAAAIAAGACRITCPNAQKRAMFAELLRRHPAIAQRTVLAVSCATRAADTLTDVDSLHRLASSADQPSTQRIFNEPEQALPDRAPASACAHATQSNGQANGAAASQASQRDGSSTASTSFASPDWQVQAAFDNVALNVS